ncbi:helix-turn-helix domain-containing protein [Paenibacillus roseipurpureus]|uniref:AraC family transcriptional regulator n=1 Tax=Paenibacillus roseopurpureus TaxID=2918901 RepID=A0AA96RNB0_9BACL|nr:AraC family transcriptional regulator [Paenibacillus sp. MBLB1832]WNR45247.1 AraC family transcriptional regulator [Paenibacillus sp. MBLB1832]
MNQIVKNFAISAFHDNSIQWLLNSPEDDVFTTIRSISQLDKLTEAASAFLKTAVVYNKRTGQYIPGNHGLVPNEEMIINQLRSYMEQKKTIPKFQFIPMSLNNSLAVADKPIDFFASYMYVSDSSLSPDQALILIINPNWLFENIEILNNLADRQQSDLFVMIGNNITMNAKSKKLEPPNKLSQSVMDHYRTTGNSFDYWVADTDLGKQVITYIRNEANDWTIVNVIPYEVLLSKLRAMRYTTAVVTLLFLLVSGIATLLISHRLYRPIERLFSQFSGESEDKGKGSDEINYMSNVYKRLVDELQTARKEQLGKLDIVKSYQLRRLLNESPYISKEEFHDVVSQSGFRIAVSGNYCVIAFKIDNYHPNNVTNSETEKQLILFAISNIAEEFIATTYRCQTMDIKNDMVVLLASDIDGLLMEQQLIGLLKEIQTTVLKYYRISVTAAVSEIVSNYSEISGAFARSQQYLLYRLIFGHLSIILPEMVKVNFSNSDNLLPPELERNLVEAIHSCDLAKVEEHLLTVIGVLSKYSYDQIIHSLFYMNMLFKYNLKEAGFTSDEIEQELSILSQSILETETLDHIKKSWMIFFGKVWKKNSEGTDRYSLLIQTIKDIIESDYNDLNLSLKSISDMLRMSSVYVGKIFRDSQSSSVAEFINETRLRHALQLLTDRELNIGEIMKLVGYGNESQFFRLFKKRFGMTPKEYKLKIQVENAREINR